MKAYKVKDRQTGKLIYTVGNAMVLSVIRDINNEFIVLFITNGTIIHSEKFDTKDEVANFIVEESNKIAKHVISDENDKFKQNVKMIEPILLKQARSLNDN